MCELSEDAVQQQERRAAPSKDANVDISAIAEIDIQWNLIRKCIIAQRQLWGAGRQIDPAVRRPARLVAAPARKLVARK